MTNSRIKFLLLLLLLVTAIGVRGQERPKPQLIDEFGALPCDDLLGRTDNLIAELNRAPASDAIILIHEPTKHPEFAAGRRRLIWADLNLHGLEPNRFSFYKSKISPDGEIRTQFWTVPIEAEAPIAGFEKWLDEKYDTSRRFMFGSVDEVNECPTYVPKMFAKLMLENPGSRGHIIVRIAKGHLVERFGFADGFIKELVDRQAIPRKRLRLSFTRGESTEAEFWFVPAQRKPKLKRGRKESL